jgi:membrane protease YdiL (CAAX protease family)
MRHRKTGRRSTRPQRLRTFIVIMYIQRDGVHLSMSSDSNFPLNDLSSPSGPSPSGLPPEQIGTPEEKPAPVENPLWSGWVVLLIAALTFLLPSVFLLATVLITRKFFHPVATFNPVMALVAEFAGYIAVLCFMVMFIEGQYGVPFFRAISWNWPRGQWWSLAGVGVILLLVIQGIGHFLPIPKEVPFDKFFGTTRDAYLTSLFAISFGPFMEEILFRGFLYPVLARRIGMIASIVLTGIAFGLVHGLQLSFACGPLLMIAVVGIVLTTVRAVKRSVAASMIVHVAYNFTLTALTFVGTDGFRHLEKLTQ